MKLLLKMVVLLKCPNSPCPYGRGRWKGTFTHYGDYSLVDLNRAGTPLIEIVSEQNIHSAAEARAYAIELYRRMTYMRV